MASHFKKHAFYVFGIIDFQEQLPVIIESLNHGNDVWVCVFDTLYRKRQFYYYDNQKILDFISDVCALNTSRIPNIRYYGADHKIEFDSDLKEYNPDVVFLHGAYHKYPLWYPSAGTAKVVHFAWGPESDLNKSNYKIDLNVVRRKEDLETYKKFNIDTKYFGNLRLESLKHKPVFNSFCEDYFENKKVCFLSETHIRKSSPNFEKYPELVDELLTTLRSEGYTTVWKNREKGYPKQGWASPLEYTKAKPDLVINKDLNFPSSLYYLPSIAKLNILFNGTGTFFDLVNVGSNVVVFKTQDLTAEKTQRMLEAYSSVPEHLYSMIIDPQIGNIRNQLLEINMFETNQSDFNNDQNCPSSRLLQYIK
tara:strand:+ start:3274 stop:4368 length:1095 start_codon:yes stop_codon:yes gene_type:complete